MDDQITANIAKFISETIIKQPNKVISIDEPLLTSGLVDSFSLVDLAIFIEDAYGVHIEDTELNPDTFDTLGQLVALIEVRKALK